MYTTQSLALFIKPSSYGNMGVSSIASVACLICCIIDPEAISPLSDHVQTRAKYRREIHQWLSMEMSTHLHNTTTSLVRCYRPASQPVNVRYGVVANISRSQHQLRDKFRGAQGSIPCTGVLLFLLVAGQ